MSRIKRHKDTGLFPGLSSMFDNFFRDDDFSATFLRTANLPAVNIVASKDHYTMEVAAPGLEKKDFNLRIDQGVFTVSANKEEKKEKQEKNYTRKEYNFMEFERSFWLPEDILTEKIEARYEQGILSVTLPRVEVKEKAGLEIAVR